MQMDKVTSSVPWGAESATNGGHAVFVLDSDYQGDNHEDNPHFNRFLANGSEAILGMI